MWIPLDNNIKAMYVHVDFFFWLQTRILSL